MPLHLHVTEHQKKWEDNHERWRGKDFKGGSQDLFQATISWQTEENRQSSSWNPN